MADIKIRVGAALDASVQKSFDTAEKAAAKAAARTQKEWEKASREQQRAQDRADREIAKSLEKRVREEQKAANEVTRAEGRAARERARENAQLTREVQREAARRLTAEKQALREIEREESRSLRAREREREAAARAAARAYRGGAIGIGRRAAISVSRGAALSYGLGGRAISSAFHEGRDILEAEGLDTRLAAHVGNVVAQRQQATEIVNAAYIPGGQGAQGQLQDAGEVLNEVRKVANATATDTSETLKGLRSFVALTGDLETGRATLMDIAKLARATGSDFDDMSKAAAEVSNHLVNVKDRGGAVTAVMRVIAGQGKLGAVEIKDLARQMAKIASNAGFFEGGTARVIGELGLLAQESKLRGGSASASQAATSVVRFAQDLSKPTTLKHWTAAGLNPFTDANRTTLRTPEELILEALKFSKGNQVKLANLFPNAMSVRAVRGFSAIYTETKGTEAEKLAAVHEEFERLRKAQLDAAEVTRAFGDVMSTSKSKIQVANNKLDEMAGHIEEAVLPAIAGLAPAIEALTPAVTGAVNALADFLGLHPNEDEEARKRRSLADRQAAIQRELGAAEDVAPGVGKKGELVTGTIDAGHLKQIEKDTEEANKKVEEERAKVDRHKDLATRYKELGFRGVDLGPLGRVGLPFYDKDKANAAAAKEQLDLNKLIIAANRQNDLLERLHNSMTLNGIKVVGGQAPTKADGSGTMPAESPEPEHQ